MWATTKYVSWSAKSTGTEAANAPSIPPMRNIVRNPSANRSGVASRNWPRHIVKIQLKNFTPFGTAIRNVIRLKNGR